MRFHLHCLPWIFASVTRTDILMIYMSYLMILQFKFHCISPYLFKVEAVWHFCDLEIQSIPLKAWQWSHNGVWENCNVKSFCAKPGGQPADQKAQLWSLHTHIFHVSHTKKRIDSVWSYVWSTSIKTWNWNHQMKTCWEMTTCSFALLTPLSVIFTFSQVYRLRSQCEAQSMDVIIAQS